MNEPKKENDFWIKVFAAAFVIVIIAGIIAAGMVFRTWMAGGDFACAWASDPALCAAVKNR